MKNIMKKYLVTGAAGHLGLTIIKELIDSNNVNIRAFVLPNDKNVENLPNGIEICYGDVTKKDDVDKFFLHKNNDELIVIHCAGIVTIASKFNQAVYDVNVNGTKNIVDACIRNNVSRLVYVSSVHAIKELPNREIISETKDFDSEGVIGLYAKTKSEATKYVLDNIKNGLNAVVVHPSGIAGPNDYGHGHITQLIIDFYNGSLTAGVKGGYDFVDVRDVADGIIKAANIGKCGETYILSNKYFEVKDVIKIIAKVTNKKAIKTYLPLWFAQLTAPLAELYYKILKQTPLYTKYSLYTLQSNSNFSHDKATKELNYKTRPFEDTVKDTIVFLKEIGRI